MTSFMEFMTVLIVLVIDVFVIDQHNEYIKLCGITALLGIILETNKHHNLVRLNQPVSCYNLWPLANSESLLKF